MPNLRTDRHQQSIDSLAGLIRNCSVVLAELWRGASKPSEHKFLAALERNHPVFTPTEKNWLESGKLLNRLYRGKGLTPEKLRDLHFDVLIALTARSHGARLITTNRRDFELILSLRKFDLEVW